MSVRSKLCFVHTAASDEEESMHPVHRRMAEYAGADVQIVYRKWLPSSLNGSILSDILLSSEEFDTEYDTFVFESPSSLYLLPKVHRQIRDSNVVHLYSNVRFFGADMYPLLDFDIVSRHVGRVNQRIDASILRWLTKRYVDGFVAVSELFARRASWFDGKISVATPFIRHELLNSLERVSPDYSSMQAVYVGHGRGHKGLDILVEAWELVRQSYPGAELTLYGRGHSESYATYDGVEVSGYADSLTDALSNAALFVHPARLDAHPVTPIEAMYAGVPAIVTGNTGSREAVSRVDRALIAEETTPETISAAICRYFESDVEEKRRLASKSKRVGRQYTEDVRKGEFSEALRKVTE